jgi:uncharacterized SAM-binding protein YcdF (DUF218 family)
MSMRAITSTPPRNQLDGQKIAATPNTVLARSDTSKRLCGLLVCKERWGLSWRGWLVIISVALFATGQVFWNVYPFLAATDRVNAKILVVEGWIHRYAMRAAAEEFNRGSYERIFTTGGPENGSGGYVNDYQTSASVGAEALKKLGIPDEVIEMAPSRVIGRDRTYSSAVALRDWFREHNISVYSVNVLTQDCHARRTELLFQKALGKNVQVGIIAVANPDYNPKYWWRYSDGVREVIGESIAYIYARLFFYPFTTPPVEEGTGSSNSRNGQ